MAELFDYDPSLISEPPQPGPGERGGPPMYSGTTGLTPYEPVSSGGDVPTSLPSIAPQPLADVKQPRSIMDRMRALGSMLVNPQEEGNPYSSPLARIGQTMQAVGEHLPGGRGGGDFWQKQQAMEERMRTGKTSDLREQARLGMDIQKHQLVIGKAQREAQAEQAKQKAYENLENVDLSNPDNLELGKLWNVVVPLLKAGDEKTAGEFLKLGISARSDEAIRKELMQVQTAIGTAKTAEEADAVLGSLSPKLMKEHGTFLQNTVKRRFPDEGKGKSIATNDVIAFKASKGSIRGPSIPENFSLTNAEDFLKDQRSLQQQQITLTTGQQEYKRGAEIQSDFERETKSYRDIRTNMRTFQGMYKQQGRIAELGLVRQVMMAMDPPGAPSIVRESEAELVERARKNIIYTPLKEIVERFAGKRTITNEQRRQIKDIIENRYKAEREGYEEKRKYYGGLARGVRLPEDVLGEKFESLLSPTGTKSGTKAPSSKEQRLKGLGF